MSYKNINELLIVNYLYIINNSILPIKLWTNTPSKTLSMNSKNEYFLLIKYFFKIFNKL